MMRSLFAAVSGLRNHQLSMSVIGNNIANINTIGFKGGRALFQEMLSQTIQGAAAPTPGSAGSNPVQIGLGMSVSSISSSFNQGQLQLTGNMLDMAVQGEGFFVTRSGRQNFFSRAGAFGFDGDGRLTAGQGLLVQGWLANDDGDISSGVGVTDITLPFGQKSPARQTSQIKLASNLDASAEALSTITETGSLRSTALSTDQVETLFNSTGQDLGVQDGDVLQIQYAATPYADVVQLSSASAAPIDLEDGDTIVVSDGTSSTDIIFRDNWSLQVLANQVEAAILAMGNETDVSVSVSPDGALLFTNGAGGNSTDLSVTLSSAGRSVFNSLVASVPVINGTSTAKSQQMIVNRTLTVGENFSNVSSMAAAVEQVLQIGSSGAQVTFSGGRLTYDNADDLTGNTYDLVDLVYTRPGSAALFETAMGLTGNNLLVGATLQSDLMLDTAEEADNLTDLYSTRGDHLGLTTGDVFTFDVNAGGSPLSQTTFSVVATGDGTSDDFLVQTLGGLVDELKNVLELTTAGNVELTTDGAITITGKSGLSHELRDLVFNETGNDVLSNALTFTDIQSATDVTHQASIRVFDALGTAQNLAILFTKDNDTDNRWDWEVSVEDGEIVSGGTGSVTFNGDGSLSTFVTDDGQPLTVNPGSGANGPMVVNFDAGTRGGIDGITGFARESTTSIVDQNGFAMGTLESISVDGNGVITGDFTNGTSRPLAQLALASFKNAPGLQRDGGNGWQETANSGEAIIRRPGADSEVGAVSAGTLEMSNVDIAQEFTSMIVAQRGFQANARTVTTSDEMLVELVNLKR